MSWPFRALSVFVARKILEFIDSFCKIPYPHRPLSRRRPANCAIRSANFAHDFTRNAEQLANCIRAH